MKYFIAAHQAVALLIGATAPQGSLTRDIYIAASLIIGGLFFLACHMTELHDRRQATR